MIHLNREALVTIRERSGLTQGQLAVAVGTSPGYMNDIESGRRHPSPQLLRLIAEALAVPLPAIVNQPVEAKS